MEPTNDCDQRKSIRLNKNGKLTDEKRIDLISSMPEARLEPLTRERNPRLQTENERKAFVEYMIYLAWFACASMVQLDKHDREFNRKFSTAMNDPLYNAAIKRLELKMIAAKEFCNYLDNFHVGAQSRFNLSKIL